MCLCFNLPRICHVPLSAHLCLFLVGRIFISFFCLAMFVCCVIRRGVSCVRQCVSVTPARSRKAAAAAAAAAVADGRLVRLRRPELRAGSWSCPGFSPFRNRLNCVVKP